MDLTQVPEFELKAELARRQRQEREARLPKPLPPPYDITEVQKVCHRFLLEVIEYDENDEDDEEEFDLENWQADIAYAAIVTLYGPGVWAWVTSRT